MSSDNVDGETAPQDDNITTGDNVPPQSLASRRGVAPLNVSAGIHPQIAPRVTPSTTASSASTFSFMPYGPYPHLLSPPPPPNVASLPPSPQYPMPLELTLAIGRAALQQAPTPQTLKAPDELHASKQSSKQKESMANEQQESVTPESSNVARVREPVTVVTGGPKESVASSSVPAVETQDSLDVQEEMTDSAKMMQKKPVATTKQTAARTSRRKRQPRTVDKDTKVDEEATSKKRKRPPAEVKLSSLPRRKQRKDMPEQKESVASASIVEKYNSLDVQEETKDSPEMIQKPVSTTKPGAARISYRTLQSRTADKAKKVVTSQSPVAEVNLSSSQRRKQRKDMPVLPGGVFVTVTPHSPVPKRRKNQKQK